MSALQSLTHSRSRGPARGSGNNRGGGSGSGGSSPAGPQVARQAQDLGRRFQVLGRAGWVAKGLVYVLIGVVSLNIALDRDASDEEASGAGAIATLAERSYGKLLVAVLGVGLVLYMIWRVFTAFLPGDWTGKALLERIGYFVSALIYASLALTIAQILRSGAGASDKGSEDRKVSSGINSLMDQSYGRGLVGLVGVVVAVIAIAFAHKAYSRGFEDDLNMPADQREHKLIVRLGQFGWGARAASMALIAVFLLRAAYAHRSDQVGGIDASLREFTRFSWGQLAVGTIAVGFIAYGAFCVVSARHQRLEGPTNAG